MSDRHDKALQTERSAHLRFQAEGDPFTAGAFRHAVKGNASEKDRRPRSTASDHRWVPGALAHWRRVHGITAEQAATRTGAADGHQWSLWERGEVTPTYMDLLRIVAATGLGYWIDADARASLDAQERLEVDRVRHATIATGRLRARRAAVDGLEDPDEAER
jgi:transcriptional regulator with XRE-family HTH domain